VVPAGVLAIAELENRGKARLAIENLAYARLGTSILHLQRAPSAIWAEKADSTIVQGSSDPPVLTAEKSRGSACLFIKNLPRAGSTEDLNNAFQDFRGFLSSTVPVSSTTAKAQGYGFVHFRDQSSATAAMVDMQGAIIGGRAIVVESSQHREAPASLSAERVGLVTSEGRSSVVKSSLILKNLPFEATRSDLHDILWCALSTYAVAVAPWADRTLPFSIYGEIQALRLPKKIGNQLRGFAFVQYATESQARSAIAGLRHSHYLGRHIIAEEACSPLSGSSSGRSAS
jgi:multiple RNA-binding domain-containing protein 1